MNWMSMFDSSCILSKLYGLIATSKLPRSLKTVAVDMELWLAKIYSSSLSFDSARIFSKDFSRCFCRMCPSDHLSQSYLSCFLIPCSYLHLVDVIIEFLAFPVSGNEYDKFSVFHILYSKCVCVCAIEKR